jgi:polyhydroxyalkanoate synthase
MTDQSKDFPDPTVFGTAREWRDIWTQVAMENQNAMTRYELNFGNPFPSYPIHTSLFDPEAVVHTVGQAMAKLAEKPEILEDIGKRYLDNVQAMFQLTSGWLSGKPMESLVKVEATDKRFRDPLWKEDPFFSMIQQGYLLNAQFLRELISNIDGLDPLTDHKLRFYTNHLIDALSPTNFPFTNPTVLQETFSSSGENLIKGFQNYLNDLSKGQSYAPITDMNAFKVGQNLATTPGQVVFQNDLFQLIQYDSLTAQVARQPLLIIPPWINKYYIFDLQPENSFIRWALESGLTVFIISWVNPDERYAQKTMTDYVLEGAKTALDQICEITGAPQVNALGHCGGGILLSSLLVYLKAKKDCRIASATITVTPFDFSKVDGLSIFRCKDHYRKLKKYVAKKGYLDGQYMVQAFNLLRANDLIWSSYINNYLLGREPYPFDLLFWNCDALRMPGKMHLDYLRDILINNGLMMPGKLHIADVPINLHDISTPLFMMAAIDDHITPWKSLYPLTQLAQSATKKFVLGASGHVAGVMNHPRHQKYHYWTSDHLPQDPDDWLKNAEQHAGSWWGAWRQWLDAYSGGIVPARHIQQNRILEAAPGSYVMTVGE